MGRARSAVAARVSITKMRAAAEDAFGVEEVETRSCDDFYDAMDFCRPRSELLGGEIGQEAWYLWRVGDWTILGDLTMELPRNLEALARLSKAVGPLIVTGIDIGFEYASFAYLEDGTVKRRRVLEDEEILEEGLPVKAERGRHLDDFNEEEAGRLWTSYGLPTFDHDPLDGPFECVAVKLPG